MGSTMHASSQRCFHAIFSGRFVLFVVKKNSSVTKLLTNYSFRNLKLFFPSPDLQILSKIIHYSHDLFSENSKLLTNETTNGSNML